MRRALLVLVCPGSSLFLDDRPPPRRKPARSPAWFAIPPAAAIPGATIQIVSQAGSPTLDAVTDAQGAYRVDAARARPVPRPRRARWLRSRSRGGRRRARADGDARPHAQPVAPDRVGRRHGRRVEEVAAGSAHSLVGAERRAGRERGSVQRQSREGAGPDRPVLLLEPPQLLGDHPRASAHPSGSPTTASSRASGCTSTASSTRGPRPPRSISSTSSGSRCCADRRGRSSARTRRPAPST